MDEIDQEWLEKQEEDKRTLLQDGKTDNLIKDKSKQTVSATELACRDIAMNIIKSSSTIGSFVPSLQEDISNKLGCLRRVTILDSLNGVTLGQSNGSTQVTRSQDEHPQMKLQATLTPSGKKSTLKKV